MESQNIDMGIAYSYCRLLFGSFHF